MLPNNVFLYSYKATFLFSDCYINMFLPEGDAKRERFLLLVLK